MKGFRDFVLRGNVIDLAVAVVIGAAFKTIIDKFVEGIINPLLGALVGKPDFDNAFIIGPVKVGLVLTAVVNFLLMAAVIYLVLVLPMNRILERRKKAEQAAPPEPPADVQLLSEIRDLLKAGPG